MVVEIYIKHEVMCEHEYIFIDKLKKIDIFVTSISDINLMSRQSYGAGILTAVITGCLELGTTA